MPTPRYTVVHARLRKSRIGWLLAPACRNAVDLLRIFYGDEKEYCYLTPEKKMFCSGQVASAAMTYVSEECQRRGLGVKFVPGEEPPRIEMWKLGDQPIKRSTFNVSVGRRCWVVPRSVWTSYAPGIYARMEKSFTAVAGPVLIRSSPAYSGIGCEVVVSKGAGQGRYFSNWRKAMTMAGTLRAAQSHQYADVLPTIRYANKDGEWIVPGIEYGFSHEAAEFGDLMEKIAGEEAGFHVFDAEQRKIAKGMIEG